MFDLNKRDEKQHADTEKIKKDNWDELKRADEEVKGWPEWKQVGFQTSPTEPRKYSKK